MIPLPPDLANNLPAGRSATSTSVLADRLDALIDAVGAGTGIRIDSVNTIDTARELADRLQLAMVQAKRGGVHSRRR